MHKIVSKKLKLIKKNQGNIFPILKSSSNHFQGFGEVYISSIDYNVVRAWKRNKFSSQYFVVPVGSVKFVFLTDEKKKIFEEIIIGENNYSFINIPPNVWYGFANLSDNTSFIVNVLDKPYDPDESESLKPEDFPFAEYSW